MGIDWTAFTWDAFATLATGVAAVAAAGAIGWRQSQIQSRQVALQEQELRVSLLDRRLAVYDSVHQFFSFILVEGRPAEGEIEQNYRLAMVQARFLFSDELNKFLRAVWSKHCDFGLHKTLSHDRRPKDEADRIKNVRMAANDLKWLVDEFGRLHEHFHEIKPIESNRKVMVPSV